MHVRQGTAWEVPAAVVACKFDVDLTISHISKGHRPRSAHMYCRRRPGRFQQQWWRHEEEDPRFGALLQHRLTLLPSGPLSALPCLPPGQLKASASFAMPQPCCREKLPEPLFYAFRPAGIMTDPGPFGASPESPGTTLLQRHPSSLEDCTLEFGCIFQPLHSVKSSFRTRSGLAHV